MRATAPADGSQSAERQAAHAEAATARKIRTAEQKHADRVGAQQKEAQRSAEKAGRAQAVAQAVVEERLRKDAERRAQVEAGAKLKTDQKAARDAKYAARKARQK
jgi:hypothetical protein